LGKKRKRKRIAALESQTGKDKKGRGGTVGKEKKRHHFSIPSNKKKKDVTALFPGSGEKERPRKNCSRVNIHQRERKGNRGKKHDADAIKSWEGKRKGGEASSQKKGRMDNLDYLSGEKGKKKGYAKYNDLEKKKKGGRGIEGGLV